MKFVRLTTALILLAASTAMAQVYPSKPVRIVAPAPAGGGTDILSRQFSMRWSAQMGRPVIVDNVSGANGNIGAAQVARSAGDGYTLLMSYVGTQAINPALYKNMPYDADADLIPIGNIATYTFVIAVNSDVPVHSYKELTEYIRANPGKLSFGSAGIGSGGHLVGELYNSKNNVKLVHIPYKGSAPLVQDLIGGQVQVVFDTLASLGPFIKSGKIRALAVTSPTRLAAFPDIPSVKEVGAADMVVSGWYGLFAPKGTPAPVLDTVSAALKSALENNEFKERITASGYIPASVMSREAYRKFVQDETRRWGDLVRISGASAD